MQAVAQIPAGRRPFLTVAHSNRVWRRFVDRTRGVRMAELRAQVEREVTELEAKIDRNEHIPGDMATADYLAERISANWRSWPELEADMLLLRLEDCADAIEYLCWPGWDD